MFRKAVSDWLKMFKYPAVW